MLKEKLMDDLKVAMREKYSSNGKSCNLTN